MTRPSAASPATTTRASTPRSSAIAAANHGHQIAYGEDAYTARLQEVFRHHFGDHAEAFPVFNGTGANVVGLQSMLPRWGAVIAASTAHINVDEGGAPERVAGIKILNVTDDGKLTPELVDREAWGWRRAPRAAARRLDHTVDRARHATPDEIAALADHAHARGMRLHLDGARISNAAAALDLPLRAFTTDVGVDVLSFGGTKNGALGGEAVVVLDPAAAEGCCSCES
jgi:threonine aldolase